MEVPFAFDDNGAEVTAENAATGAVYKCPACGDSLGSQSDYERKDGTGVRRHFFHRNSGESCSQESLEHWYAKYLIHRSIVWGDEVKIVIPCTMCTGHRALIPPEMDDAQVERALGNGRTPDVTGFYGGAPVFLVEVFYTHASEDYSDLPWIEVFALDIIEDPSTWKSTRKAECEDCAGRVKKEKKRMEDSPMMAKSFDVYKGCWYIESDSGGLYEHYLSIGYRELSPGVLTDIPVDIFNGNRRES